MDTPGFKPCHQPAVPTRRWPCDSAAGSSAPSPTGTHRSGLKPTCSPKNSRGVTPITVAGTPFTTISLAENRRIRLNRVCQYRPAHHRHRGSPAHQPVVLRTNQPADRRLHAERREEGPDHVLAVDRSRHRVLRRSPGSATGETPIRSENTWLLIAKVLVVLPREAVHARLARVSVLSSSTSCSGSRTGSGAQHQRC